jgi:uncharacterized protein YeaO (DUF488 family)
MGDEVRLWQVGSGDELTEISRAKLDLEERIENWIARDISVLDPRLLVIGKQVPTAFGTYIDLLCIDASGNLVIVELKRDKTPREVVAQALDYAPWVKDLSPEQIHEIAAKYLKETDLESAFKTKFKEDLQVLNDRHAMRVVASEIDDSTERIIRYLSESYGVDINAIRFQFLQAPDGRQLLVRTFTVAPEEAETNIKKRPGKRSPPATSEEMEEAAVQAGVGDLYRRFRQALAPYFRTGTTKTTCFFQARFPDDSLKVVFSLVPAESSTEKGLRYRLFSKRLADFIGSDENAILEQLPPDREPFEPYASGDTTGEFKGWAGYIKSEDDIRKIAGLVEKAPRADAER